ncbi:hypothetical protein [Bacillus pseudomycoides]|uniref:hypothetical protein n=1 Tax=Bacillus pseudomycoides TaxID=64104 RepID=UPI001C558E0E|nr:hypothetical protein [Bacillus pseudomycoides]
MHSQLKIFWITTVAVMKEEKVDKIMFYKLVKEVEDSRNKTESSPVCNNKFASGFHSVLFLLHFCYYSYSYLRNNYTYT